MIGTTIWTSDRAIPEDWDMRASGSYFTSSPSLTGSQKIMAKPGTSRSGARTVFEDEMEAARNQWLKPCIGSLPGNSL